MKKIFVLLSLAFIFNSCDDGDIKLESFNFTNQQIQKCADKNFLYKINNDELLLFDIPAELYTYNVNQTEFPYTLPYPITGTTKVIYRLYNDKASNQTICNTIAPATPVVTNEWIATGGTIEVTTTQRFEADGITLAGYTHSFTLKNVNFASTNNSFSFVEYFFGNYQSNL